MGAVRDAARLGPIVDVACGRGRNLLAATAAGARGVGIDCAADALADLARAARAGGRRIALVRADLERGHALPLAPGSAGCVLVFRYLWRPVLGALQELLAPGGLLLYETFTRDGEKLGHGPRNPAFLLERGELRAAFPGLLVEDWEEGLLGGDPEPAALARLRARRPRG